MAIVGYWRMNGNSNDASGNGYNGSDTDISYAQGYGITNSGAKLSASTSKITIASMSPHLDSNLSISLWANLASLPTGYFASLFVCHVSSYNNYWIFLDLTYQAAGNYLEFYKYNGTENPGFQSSIVPPTSKWIYVTGVILDAKIKLYYNGVYLGETDDTTTSVPSYTNNYIGRQALRDDRYLLANIDEVKVSNSAWSAAEIKNEYSRMKGFFT